MSRPRRLPTRSVPRGCVRGLAAFGAFLACATALSPLAVASADDCAPARWDRYRTPTHDDLLVLPGSDIERFVLAGPDGSVIYAIGTWNSPCAHETPEDPFAPTGLLFDAGQAPRLWMSTDSGLTWQDRTVSVLDAANLPDAGTGVYDDFLVFTAVAAAPDNPDVVIVAGYNRNGAAVIAGSHDGAEKFTWLGCGAIDGMILCASVSPAMDDTRLIAIGTSDPLDGGKVWRFEAGRLWGGSWHDTSDDAGWAATSLWAGDPSSVLAVTTVRFSPRFREDRTVLATVVALAEEPGDGLYTGFYLVAGTWESATTWNAAAGFDGYPLLIREGGYVIHSPASPPALLLRDLATLTIPEDYDGDLWRSRTVLVAVNGSLVNPSSGSVVVEGGFLFAVDGSTSGRDMLASEDNPWVASIAYHGMSDMLGRLMVGTSFPGAWTWQNILDWHDDGAPGNPCCDGVTVLLATTTDPCCPRWDRSVRPPSGQFNAQVAWSTDGETAYAGTSGRGRMWHDARWYADESAFSRSVHADWEETGLIDTMIDEIVDVADDPSSGTLHLHTGHGGDEGSVCKCESIWRSTDEGATWVRTLHGKPSVSDSDEDAFEDIMDGYYRGFYRSRSEGYLQAAGVRYIIGDAIDDDDDQQVDAGLEANTVYRLVEGTGSDWDPMTALTLDYTRLVYASCVDAPGGTLYAGFDNLWWDFTVNMPLPYEDDGSDPVQPAEHDCRKVSGAARYLDESGDCCPTYEWDYLLRGLRGTGDTNGLYEHLRIVAAGCRTTCVRLWAIDRGSAYWAEDGEDAASYDWCRGEFANELWGRLWKYDDCYAMASVATITGDEPLTISSDPCRCANEEFVVEWDRLCDACEYDIQLATDRRFTHMALETEAFVVGGTPAHAAQFYRPREPATPSLLVAKGMLECNQAYWWRVRAHMAETDEVIRSWWSEPVSFHTAPGPPGLIELRSPGDGATGVAVKSVGFTWTAVSGANRYDFMLVDREQGHVASQVGDFTAFVLPLALEYDTPYVWRVIALDGDRVVAESARATFRTEPQAGAPADVASGATLVPPSTPQQPGWIWYFVAILALLLAGLLAILSRVNRRLRRSRKANLGPGGRVPFI